jgi:5-methylcytosine-specific restriction endonuclease McrA
MYYENYNKYREYLQSSEWANIKIDLIHNRGNKCESCGKIGYVQVHHLTYDRLFNEEPSDLVLLCAGCHKAEHGIVTKEMIAEFQRKNRLTNSNKKSAVKLTQEELAKHKSEIKARNRKRKKERRKKWLQNKIKHN